MNFPVITHNATSLHKHMYMYKQLTVGHVGDTNEYG